MRGPKELHKATAKAAAPQVTAPAAEKAQEQLRAYPTRAQEAGVPAPARVEFHWSPDPAPVALAPRTLGSLRRLREGAQPASDGHRGAGLRRHADRHRADAE